MFQTHLCHMARFLSLSLSLSHLPSITLFPILYASISVSLSKHAFTLSLSSPISRPSSSYFPLFLFPHIPFPFHPHPLHRSPTYYLNATVPILVPFYLLKQAICPSSSDIRGRVSSPPRGRQQCQSGIDLTLTVADYKFDQLGAYCAHRIRIGGRYEGAIHRSDLPVDRS